MASPGIGPNGPHEQKTPKTDEPTPVGGSPKNPAKKFAEEVGSPDLQPADQSAKIGPDGPHNP